MPRSLLLAAFVFIKQVMRPETAPAIAAGATRPAGSVVWIHVDKVADQRALVETAERLLEQGGLGAVVMTGMDHVSAEADPTFPQDVIPAVFPGENRSAIDAFLLRWRPDLLVLTGTPLRPVLSAALDRRGIAAILVAGRIERASYKRWRWAPPVARRVLRPFRALLAEDWRTARAIRRLGVSDQRVELGGGLETAAPPLGCPEAEREALSKQLRGRTVWFVAGAILSEMHAVIAAYQEASRLAHRLLLVLAPANPGDGDAMIATLRDAGLETARRSEDEDPDEEVQAFIADDEGELGMWYRLAPMTFLGGSLQGDGPVRDPFEPAALGSAVLHGPVAGDWRARLARLAEARAVRSVTSEKELCDAVCELIAPDRVALLAHQGWEVVSGGAELADRLVSIALAAMPQPAATAVAITGEQAA